MNNSETNEFSSYNSRENKLLRRDFWYELNYLLEKCCYISNLKTKNKLLILEFNYSSSKECALNAVRNLIDIAEAMTDLSAYDNCPMCDLKLGIRRIERELVKNRKSLRKSIKLGPITNELYNSLLEMFKLEAVLRNKGIDNSQRITNLFLRVFVDN